jgi:tetratricopeptide (TPR) repeat protein
MAALALAVCLTAMTSLSGCAAFKDKKDAAMPKKSEAAVLAAGDAALARGDRNEAGRLYLMALKGGADPAMVHTRLGDLTLGAGATKKAQFEYEKAIKANDKYAQAWQGLGFALYLNGSQTEAAEALGKALAIEPGLSRGAALLGTIENRRGNPQLALSILDAAQAVRFDPDVENNRGLSLMLLDRPQEAADAFRRSLDARKSAKVANNLGLALCRLGRYDEAYASFAAAGSEAAALNNLGVCFMEAGDKARAHQYFERAIAANPSYYQKAQANLRRLAAMEEVKLPSPEAPAPAPPGQTAPPPAPVPVARTPAPIPAAKTPAPVPVPVTPVVAQPPAPPTATPKPVVVPPARTRNPSAAEKADRTEMP